MEKKTIGKFISALRRANGMTQKELAEKLFVSDKTVSRWECDECAPDLALIPVIAELFSITSDELLRGERNNSAKRENDGGRYSLKGEKQIKTMLSNCLKKCGNLTMISLGLAIVGWLVGVLCNFAFLKGMMGFVFGSIFFLSSEICQICFTRSMRIAIEEEEEAYQVRIEEVNRKIARTLIQISVLNLLLFAFTLPLAFAGNYGFAFEAWLGFGLIFTAVTAVLAYITYTLWIKPLLIKKDVLSSDNVADEKRRRNVNRMSKIGAVVGIVALLVGGAVWTVNIIGWKAFASSETYHDAQSFKARMEADYDKWFENGMNGETVVFPAPDEEYYETCKDHGFIYDENGEKVEYFYNRDFYSEIEYLKGGQSVPVKVITEGEAASAWQIFNDVQTYIWLLLPVDIAVGIAVCAILLFKDRKSKE